MLCLFRSSKLSVGDFFPFIHRPDIYSYNVSHIAFLVLYYYVSYHIAFYYLVVLYYYFSYCNFHIARARH